MFALRPYHRGVREALWMAVMAVLAAAILLMMSVKLAGAAAPAPPRFLPSFVADWQQAVSLFRAGDFACAHERMQDVRNRVAPGIPEELPHDRGLALWSALAAQANAKSKLATSDWARIELPAETRVWKHIAMTAMLLETGRNDEAAEELAKAELLDPANPLVYYYLGILHIQRADEAVDWPDYVQAGEVRLAVNSRSIVPNTKGIYELAASQDLERSAELAACFDARVSLIPADWTTEPELCPTVADLLMATGAMNFERNAHHMLGYLFFERGALEIAEEHLDQAKGLGAEVPYLFNDLGEQYAAEGRHRDAARAYLKAVGNGPDRVGALMRFFQNFADSVRE